MKVTLTPALLLTLLVPVVSLAQDNSAAAAQQFSSNESRRTEKPRTVAGLVGADAKIFLDTKHIRWMVANPAALSGFENQRVKVRYVLTIDRSQMRIVSVKPAQSETQNTAYKTDSAFRR